MLYAYSQVIGKEEISKTGTHQATTDWKFVSFRVDIRYLCKPWNTFYKVCKHISDLWNRLF